MRHRTTVVMSLKWQHSPFLDRSNSDDFECFLEVCFGHYAFVETGADDERIRFGRAMSGQARQKLPPTFSTNEATPETKLLRCDLFQLHVIAKVP
jgi:hypothetical protein